MRKVEIDPTKPNTISEKLYVTEKIETSITLLDSPESKLVLEALLFLSKFADIQQNNLVYIQSHGLMPKLITLFDHNICILRVSLRLLSQLLTLEAAQIELNQEKFDDAIRTICRFYVSHGDVNIKEFSGAILAIYAPMGKTHVILEESNLISALLKTIKEPENYIILKDSLELFKTLTEIEPFRKLLHQEKDFKLNTFLSQMQKSDYCLRLILRILEKLTYFAEEEIQQVFKDEKLIEEVINIFTDLGQDDITQTSLNIILHCVLCDVTKSYFITSFEFLKLSHWAKTCAEIFLETCAAIYLELSKIGSIRQMLFDLSIENTILSFLRSDQKRVLNSTCEAICFMSKHKYCCEKIVTPCVVKKLLDIMQRMNDEVDPNNDVALSTLNYFCRRDSRTTHMIHKYEGMPVMFKYLKEAPEKLSKYSHGKVLEMFNMFVTNSQLQRFVCSPDLYEAIFDGILNKSDEICIKSLEIMINCLFQEDFQDYFLTNEGYQIISEKLSTTDNEDVIRLLVLFIHNAITEQDIAKKFVYSKVFIILKNLSKRMKLRIPLIGKVTCLFYDMCLPLKFFETGRLELLDKIKERFYVINGPWKGPFPFLEILELNRISTLSTIYVVDNCHVIGPDCSTSTHNCLNIQQQEDDNHTTCSDLSQTDLKCSINYGKLSHDPYLPQYYAQVEKLVSKISDLKQKIKILAGYVEQCLCGPDENCTIADKLHTFKLHTECIKRKLGTNMLPIGYLRLGFHCEKALLFKALADYVDVPTTFVKGKNKLYWNEVGLLETKKGETLLKMFVVDLMSNIGQLLPVGSRECNVYCDIQ